MIVHPGDHFPCFLCQNTVSQIVQKNLYSFMTAILDQILTVFEIFGAKKKGFRPSFKYEILLKDLC